jgi:hypothetical protein
MLRTWPVCGVCKSKTSKLDRLLGVVVPFVEGIAEKHQASGGEDDVQRLHGCSKRLCADGQSGSCAGSTSSSQVLFISFSSIIIDSGRTAVAVGHIVYP